MKHPKFNWKTYPADNKELQTGTEMNVSELNKIRRAEDNELTRMLCFNSGIRQTKGLQNWNAWNGCVYIDVDYKNYLSVNENAEDPKKVFDNVWTYLSCNYSDHFYYGEYSRSKKGFHFIFYTESLIIARTNSVLAMPGSAFPCWAPISFFGFAFILILRDRTQYTTEQKYITPAMKH